MAAKTHRRTGVEFLLTNMAQVRVCQLKKKIDLGISNTKEKDSVGHAKVVQNSTYTKNIINSHSSLLPPYRKSKDNYLTLLLFLEGGMELLLQEF